MRVPAQQSMKSSRRQHAKTIPLNGRFSAEHSVAFGTAGRAMRTMDAPLSGGSGAEAARAGATILHVPPAVVRAADFPMFVCCWTIVLLLCCAAAASEMGLVRAEPVWASMEGRWAGWRVGVGGGSVPACWTLSAVCVRGLCVQWRGAVLVLCVCAVLVCAGGGGGGGWQPSAFHGQFTVGQRGRKE